MNQWLIFSNGEINAVKVEVVISKEIAPNGNQLVHIIINDKEVYQFWHNPNKSKNKEPPKHTGGRKPYIIVMIEQVEKLKTEINNVEELVGFIVCLSNNIEWNTGKFTIFQKELQYRFLFITQQAVIKKPSITLFSPD